MLSCIQPRTLHFNKLNNRGKEINTPKTFFQPTCLLSTQTMSTKYAWTEAFDLDMDDVQALQVACLKYKVVAAQLEQTYSQMLKRGEIPERLQSQASHWISGPTAATTANIINQILDHLELHPPTESPATDFLRLRIFQMMMEPLPDVDDVAGASSGENTAFASADTNPVDWRTELPHPLESLFGRREELQGTVEKLLNKLEFPEELDELDEDSGLEDMIEAYLLKFPDELDEVCELEEIINAYLEDRLEGSDGLNGLGFPAHRV